ncbi:MAG: flagellar hook-associated protein FlgK [Kineosporiaceae bacterium]
MSGFSSLNTAVTGLNAAQRALDTISQNISNSQTEGYSRQRVKLSSIGAPVTATLWTGGGSQLGGVRVDTVERIRDAFLEGARSAAGARMSALTAQTGALQGAERLMAEPSDNGLQSVLDDFYSAWHDLAKNVTNEAGASAGSVVIKSGEAVADQLKFVYQGLAAQWTTSHADLDSVVTQTNMYSKELAAVNEQVRAGLAGDRPINELLDRRDTLARTLGELVGGTSMLSDDGTATISVNGVTIVSGARAETLQLVGADDVSTAAGNPPALMWGTTTVPVASGTAAGLLSVLASDLPSTVAAVDKVAVALRDAVNLVHGQGFRLDGVAGADFFTGTGAADLAVAVTDASELAVSKQVGAVDGSNAAAIGDLIDDRVSYAALGSPGASQQWRTLTAGLGVKVQNAERSIEVQRSVVATADDAVASDAGVNVDEEMTNMLLVQRSYQAASRVITTVDEMLDTLINRTGTVGR